MAGSSAIERATASAASTARTGAAARPCSPTSAATVSSRPFGSAARRSTSDPEASAASTERRGRGHQDRPSRSRARARRTESAAGVIGESSPVVSTPSHRAITRIPPSGDGPRPEARRTDGSDSARAIAEEASTTPRSRATSAHTIWRRRDGHPPFVLGAADALGRPRVGTDAEQPGALVHADQGHPATGERDRGAQAIAAAFRDEVEELGLLDGRRRTSDSSAPPGSSSASSEADDRRSSRTGCLNGPPPARTLAIIGPSPGTVSPVPTTREHAHQ